MKEKILKKYKNSSGYLYSDLYIDGDRTHKMIHRLVANAFVENPDNLPEVDHIDTNKENNHYSNLKWCTHSQNHLNPITVMLKRETHTGKTMSDEAKAKLSKKVMVIKDEVVIYIFKSYKELTNSSEQILGEKLYDLYARQVVNGKRLQYKGYTFKLE